MTLQSILDTLNLEPWWRFAVALVVGALIGLEREFVLRQEDEHAFAGLRTFIFIALLGALSAYLHEAYGLVPAALAFGGLILLTVSSHIVEVWRHDKAGITTEVATFVTFLLGWIAMWGQAEVALSMSVIVALILALKGWTRRMAKRMTAEDLRIILEFALVSAVVLPLLPNQTLDPWGVVNPFTIWLLVVFVSGIGFAGYLLMKFLTADTGIWITGVLGGLVSSTATTVNFSGRSRENPAFSDLFAQAILLASAVMFPRVLLEVLVINHSLVGLIALPIGLMLIAGLIVVFILRRRADTSAVDGGSVSLSNPLRITTAIGFALIFTVVLVLIQVMQQTLGTTGVYLTSFITGLTDVDAITLSVAQSASAGLMEPVVAARAIVIAAVMNSIAKAGIAYALGSEELRRIILRAFAPVAGVGFITVIGMFLL